MKKQNTMLRILALFAILSVGLAPQLSAQLAVPSDGSDGPLVATANRVIDLRLATNGAWSDNNSANAGNGIYDSSKWAVVFKYSSVSIANGATLTFTNHPTHAPVVWLVSGDVTINGELSLDGQSVLGDTARLGEPGPGGFRGGAGADADQPPGPGFGPGGGSPNATFSVGEHGSYSTLSSSGADRRYGNPQIVPLIGGSGGGGYTTGFNGAGGGGAILIAASGTITIANGGYCHANGGSSVVYNGSGGAIRLVANQIAGNGRVEAVGPGSPGYPGRIRLEANIPPQSLNLDPYTVTVTNSPLVIWPPTNAPTVRVVSVAGNAAPADPQAALSSAGDDLTIASTGTNTILLQTANFPTNGIVNVHIKPRNGPQGPVLQASYVSGTTNLATWQLLTTLPLSHSVIQARAVSP